MSSICLYIDEDAMDEEILQALRARGVDVISVAETGMLGRSNEEQLNWAFVHNRVLYSFNVRDFYRLHTTLLEQGRFPRRDYSGTAAALLGGRTNARHFEVNCC